MDTGKEEPDECQSEGDTHAKYLVFLRGELSALVIEANDLISDKDATRQGYDDLINRMDKLETLHSKTSGKLIDCCDQDDVQRLCQEISSDTRQIRSVMKKLKRNQKPPPGKKADDKQPDKVSSGKVKMPTLPLASFDGDILKFQSFWDQFRCSVHDNTEFQPVQKFLYLEKALENSPGALSVIEGYDITDVNYPLAVNSLFQRFGRKRVAVFGLVKIILSMKPPVNGTKELRDFHDLLHGRVRSLEALDLNTDNADVQMILIPILQIKLRPDLLEEWEREIGEMKDSDISVEFYFKFVEKQIVAKEAVV